MPGRQETQTEDQEQIPSISWSRRLLTMQFAPGGGGEVEEGEGQTAFKITSSSFAVLTCSAIPCSVPLDPPKPANRWLTL